jgi:HAD superfamily hydrolase (TIGR01509 family)
MIKALIFDWFGVCTKENWADCLARELHQKLGVDKRIIKKEFKQLLQPFARAEISSEKFLEKFITSLDKTKDFKEFYYLFETIPEINIELLDYISKLKNKYPVYLLSNNFGPIFPNYEKRVEFNKYFTELFLSHKLKVSKTQSEIWDVVLPKINLNPNELVFIDNKEEYFTPAKKLGLNTVLFQSNEQVKRDLAMSGVSP